MRLLKFNNVYTLARMDEIETEIRMNEVRLFLEQRHFPTWTIKKEKRLFSSRLLEDPLILAPLRPSNSIVRSRTIYSSSLVGTGDFRAFEFDSQIKRATTKF